MFQQVLDAFNIKGHPVSVIPFGSGLINNTWKVQSGNDRFILQRINQKVFKEPGAIAHNISVTGNFLKKNYPDYLFVNWVKTISGREIFYEKETDSYYRVCPFIENSHTVDVALEPAWAYEAAKQFGKFTRLLSGFDINLLQITIPDFHNMHLRYLQFEKALEEGNPGRIQRSADLISALKSNKHIVITFDQIRTNPQFKLRVTHHDTKISNVLFDENNKGLCVIDLDTLMPGYFISDVGDMLRTYLSPVSEEEKDFSRIEIRDEFFMAVLEGYLGEMAGELSEEEKKHFVYAGQFMIYMQALRFLTDYLNNDSYYGSKYEDHNLVRAGNQFTLLKKLNEKKERLSMSVEAFSQGLSNKYRQTLE